MQNIDLNYYSATRPEIRSIIPSYEVDVNSPRILEIGCGTGNFRNNFSYPVEYWGVEPFDNAAQIASDVLDRVLIGTYEKIHNELPNNYFDCVVCCDVIEHMENPSGFLNSIKDKIKPDGCLVGSIPNVRYITNLYKLLFEKDWCYTDAGTLDRTHLRFFTEKSLRKLFLDCGFEIELFYGINSISISTRTWRYFIFTVLSVLATKFFLKDAKYFQFSFRVKYVK
jgi:2-polyprenyl-3-methyl-5-hydroxy-6-metoxy-1,4-benzoquinol methylase